MKVNVVMPNLGTNMEEGTIITWYKKTGESVQKGEPLFEIMSEKATMEIESLASGVLVEIIQDENSTVPVGEVIGVIETE